MKTWRWFVGQVTRLRRSIVGAFARDEQRRRLADDESDVADEPAAGPPEHWVERVRRGAPGLLEPSLRRRSEPTRPPVDERVVLSQNEPKSRPDSLEEPERGYVPPEPMVGPRRPEAQAPARSRLVRKVLRRERFVPPAEVDASPAPTADHIPRERHAATRHTGDIAESPTREPRERRRLETSTPESPAAKPAGRRRLVDETEPASARRSVPRTDLAERSPERSEVVEFEAPTQRRTARVERAESPAQPISVDVPRPSAAKARQAELAVDEVGADRVWERVVPPPEPTHESNVDREWERVVPLPKPRRESNVERRWEPARPTSRQESSLEPGLPHRSRAEPLSAVDPHPWPELPPPLDQVDGDVEAAMRAWEHQQRLDHEQTRL